jgi:cytidine deaminase
MASNLNTTSSRYIITIIMSTDHGQGENLGSHESINHPPVRVDSTGFDDIIYPTRRLAPQPTKRREEPSVFHASDGYGSHNSGYSVYTTSRELEDLPPTPAYLDINTSGVLTKSLKESLYEDRGKLVNALMTAEKPRLTGRLVACLLDTESGTYIATNLEQDEEPHFHHAEIEALGQIASVGALSINRVVMTGAGQDKIKEVSPCFDCYDALQPYLSSSCDLVLVQPNTFTRAIVLNPEEHTEAYSPKPETSISGTTHEEIVADLRQKTELEHEDLDFVADLRLLGLDEGIHFYLSGNASGKGWVSSVLNKEFGIPYTDIDIAAVTEIPKPRVLRAVKRVARKYGYAGHIYSRNNDITSTSTEQVRTYQGGNKKVSKTKKVDLTIATGLDEAILDPNYRARNFYHAVS